MAPMAAAVDAIHPATLPASVHTTPATQLPTRPAMAPKIMALVSAFDVDPTRVTRARSPVASNSWTSPSAAEYRPNTRSTAVGSSARTPAALRNALITGT